MAQNCHSDITIGFYSALLSIFYQLFYQASRLSFYLCQLSGFQKRDKPDHQEFSGIYEERVKAFFSVFASCLRWHRFDLTLSVIQILLNVWYKFVVSVCGQSHITFFLFWISSCRTCHIAVGRTSVSEKEDGCKSMQRDYLQLDLGRSFIDMTAAVLVDVVGGCLLFIRCSLS